MQGMNTAMSGSPSLSSLVIDLGLFFAGYEDQGPDALARIFDETDLTEHVALVGENGLENLLQRLIDAAHQRHASEQVFADRADGPADDVGREEAYHCDDENSHKKPETGQSERQVGIGTVGCWYIRLHPGIDPADEGPDDIDGDRQWCLKLMKPVRK